MSTTCLVCRSMGHLCWALVDVPFSWPLYTCSPALLHLNLLIVNHEVLLTWGNWRLGWVLAMVQPSFFQSPSAKVSLIVQKVELCHLNENVVQNAHLWRKYSSICFKICRILYNIRNLNEHFYSFGSFKSEGDQTRTDIGKWTMLEYRYRTRWRIQLQYTYFQMIQKSLRMELRFHCHSTHLRCISRKRKASASTITLWSLKWAVIVLFRSQ